jgi:glycosyltransferase involved in cell wall biosynthesis
MNVLLLSNSDIDGGAARAAYRLHQGLQRINVNSQMLVQSKSSSDPTVVAPETNLAASIASSRVTFDALPLKLYPQRLKVPFSLQWFPDSVLSKITQLDPDIVNLHWINAGYVQAESIAKLGKPVVWTLHDMWAFTGGCHYTQECDRYTESCGQCPQLSSSKNQDLSRWVWQRKAKAWKQADLTVVALSRWLADCAKASSLFKDVRIELIHNGLDTEYYRPINRAFARELLRLPQDKKLILFGSLNATSDPRKGFHFLQPALQELSKAGWHDRLELVVFGSSQPQHPPNFAFKTHYLGTFNDDISLAMIYSAADIFVLPSIQENLANTVMEAMACGTPCVAFNIGGMPDMIEHQQTGFLALPYKVTDIAKGIAWILENEERYQKLSYHARAKVEQEFTQELQSRRHLSLFNQILKKTNH